MATKDDLTGDIGKILDRIQTEKKELESAIGGGPLIDKRRRVDKEYDGVIKKAKDALGKLELERNRVKADRVYGEVLRAYEMATEAKRKLLDQKAKFDEGQQVAVERDPKTAQNDENKRFEDARLKTLKTVLTRLEAFPVERIDVLRTNDDRLEDSVEVRKQLFDEYEYVSGQISGKKERYTNMERDQIERSVVSLDDLSSTWFKKLKAVERKRTKADPTLIGRLKDIDRAGDVQKFALPDIDIEPTTVAFVGIPLFGLLALGTSMASIVAAAFK